MYVAVRNTRVYPKKSGNFTIKILTLTPSLRSLLRSSFLGYFKFLEFWGTTSKETVETRSSGKNFFMFKFPEFLGRTSYNTYSNSCKVIDFFTVFTKTDFPWQNLIYSPNFNFHENLSSISQFIRADRGKDKHDENNRNFLRTRKCAKNNLMFIEIFRSSGSAFINLSEINYISLRRWTLLSPLAANLLPYAKNLDFDRFHTVVLFN
jgi:hypothetical protein